MPEQAPPLHWFPKLILGVIAVAAALLIVGLSLMVPSLLVANFGGGPSRTAGLWEWAHGLGIALAGFALPAVLRRINWIWVMLGLVVCAIVATWVVNFMLGEDAAYYAAIVGISASLGQVLYGVIGLIKTGGGPIQELRQ